MNDLLVYGIVMISLLGMGCLAQEERPNYVIAVASSMTKVHREAGRNSPALLAEAAGKPLQLDGARGEYVHGQVVIVPSEKDLSGVTWSSEPLQGPEGAAIPLRIRVVGYLKTKKPEYKVDFVGWWPDPLLSHLTTFDVPATARQPLWVTVAIPREARPGMYEGRVRIGSSDGEHSVPVRLRVRSFEIPKTRHFRIANAYAEAYGQEAYGEAWTEELQWRYRQFILDHRLNIHNIYVHLVEVPVWNMSVEKLKRLRASGQNVFFIDWIDKLHGISSRDPALFAERCKIIDAFLKRAHEAGVPDEELWFYGFDESKPEGRAGLVTISKKLKERFPQANLMTTALFPDLGASDELSQTIDAWCPATQNYEKWSGPGAADLSPQARAARDRGDALGQTIPAWRPAAHDREKWEGAVAAARARGKQVWWYVCCGPNHPFANLFIEYPAIEARLLMGMMPWKYQSDGFLYYRLSIVPKSGRLMDDGPLCREDPASWRSWNGDGCLFYYGIDGPVSTIRLENMTDGLEDYEYLWVLRDLADKLERSSLADTQQGAVALQKARRCLEVPPSTVETLTWFTQDPAEVERVRSNIAEAIEALLALGLEQD